MRCLAWSPSWLTTLATMSSAAMTAGMELSNGPTAGILSSHHVVVSEASGESGPSVMATRWTPRSARARAVVMECRR